ncbi:MAG: hypothetical protein HN750_07165, partial [Gemmatimonadales bacterium]|nr:hypothetical protein [Gemmatimonadales bacterium]
MDSCLGSSEERSPRREPVLGGDLPLHPKAAAQALVLLSLFVAAPAFAQDKDQPATVERVFVPEKGFERVLRKHPRGVMVDDDELRGLLDRASGQPPVAKPTAAPPVSAAIERLRVSGRIHGEVATFLAEADVAVLGTGTARLVLPLEGIGLRSVRLGSGKTSKAARVVTTRRGSEVLLLGGDGSGPASRRVSWEFAVRVQPGDERGSGSFRIPVPETASGRLEVSVDGEVELLPSSDGAALWIADPASSETTLVQGAFGGTAAKTVRVAYRPRRSVQEITAYSVAETRSAYLVQTGVVTLEAAVRVEVYRAPRERFQLRLPKGFVVRALTLSQGELSYVQRGEQVDVVLDAPRRGVLGFRLRAERVTGEGQDKKGETQSKSELLSLSPLGLPDLERVSGVMGLASGSDTEVSFDGIKNLERTDLAALDVRRAGFQAAATGSLLRVYRRGQSVGASVGLAVRAVKPRVDLSIKAALALSKREIRAVTLYRFEVEAGTVYVFRAYLPAGYAFETATVRDGNRRQVSHQRKERVRKTKSGREFTEVSVELERGLKAGERLLLTVQATSQRSRDLAGTRLAIPRFVGSPAERTHGHLGFAPDEAFRLAGGKLKNLVAIPAEELPRVGVDVAGLVLGYRIDGPAYGGELRVLAKETQVSAEILASHRVHERVIDSEVTLRLDVDGAPLEKLDVLLPEGAGLLARIEAPDLKEDRELVGKVEGGFERWRLSFDRRKSGRFDVTVKFGTKLSQSDSKTTQARLPQVTLGKSAFRERGTLAIYSSDATELKAETAGLQEIEVTEVPAELSAGTGRPLFAYTHVDPEFSLTLSITRHGTSEVLTAVVEQLSLDSSVGPDGTARHTATFEVKNLSNQFFGLKLPEGATLWSVSVNGAGVKPAEHAGFRVIPIPTASATGAAGPKARTVVKAVYTLTGSEWGVTGQAGLSAPVLLREGEPVPVLQTTWQLNLPDDYRVLNVAGNLKGGELVRARPLVLSSAGQVWSQPWAPGALIFLLLGLGVAVSPKAQGQLLLGLGSGGNTLRGLGGGLASAFTLKRLLIGCGGLFGLALLGSCLLFGLSRGQMEMRKSYTPSAPRSEQMHFDAGGGGADSVASAEPAPEPVTGMSQTAFKELERSAKNRGRSAPAKSDSSRRARDERRGRRPRKKTKAKRPQVFSLEEKPGAERTPPPAPPADSPMPATEMPSEDSGDDDGAIFENEEDESGGFGDKLGRLEEASKSLQKAQDPGALDGLLSLAESKKDEKGFGGEADNKPVIVLEESVQLGADLPKGTDLALLTQELPKVHGDLGAFGQVGLRSLVMQLPGVGHQQSFTRSGGGASLEVQFVREAALVTVSGLLALGGFLCLLLLPRTGKLSTVGLLVAGLGALTA